MEVTDHIGPCIKANVIEVYFDFAGIVGGQSGCWRARFKHRHGIHDAGATKDDAVKSFLRTAKTFNYSDKQKNYQIVEIKPVNVGSHNWTLDLPGSECKCRLYVGKFSNELS